LSIKNRETKPVMIPVDIIESLLLKGESFYQDRDHHIPLEDIAPDIVLVDCDVINIKWQDIEMGENAKIAEGGFSFVYKGIWNNKIVAVKEIRLDVHESPQEGFKEFRHEVSMQGKLKHPCIVTLYAICLQPFAMITEFVPHGSIDSFIHKEPDKFISYNIIIKILVDIANGLLYMHSQNPSIAHLDFKFVNVMLYDLDPKSEICAKIIDFGTSRFCSAPLKDFDNVDNPIWKAPERLDRTKSYNEKVDTYAYGLMTWETVSRIRPWDGIQYMYEVESKVREGERPIIPKHCPPQLKEIISTCWDEDPKKTTNYGYSDRKIELIKNRSRL